MKFLLCGGGTGGHVSPAIAISEALKKRYPDTKISFVGRRGGQENKAYIETGDSLYTLDMCGINRKNIVKAAKGVISAIKSLRQAYKIIKTEKPDMIIGTGGYVCWPMLTVGCRMNIPTVIHESNAYPGLVTRALSKKVDRVLLNYDAARERLKNKENIREVGNPLRKEFFAISRKTARKKLGIKDNEIFILSFGGSIGAEKINSAAISLMKKYSSKNRNIKHIHSAGRSYYEEICTKDKAFTSMKNGCIIVPYIDNMAEIMNAADIVISRCGAMTLSEISASGVSAILIPSPNVSDDHQTKNGEMLSKSSAAILLPESSLNERTLLDAVRMLENDSEKRKLLSSNIARFHQRNSCQLIMNEISEVLQSK